MRGKVITIGLMVFLCSLALGTWSTPVPVSELNTEFTDKIPYLSYDGKTIYFSRQDTDTFYFTRLYQATRPGTSGAFSNVQEISTLNYSDGHVNAAWVSPDNLRMYYNRTELGGEWRLKVAERVSTTDPWMPGTNISELNVLGHVAHPRLSADELTIFFDSSDVAGGAGESDIWMATRPDLSSPFSNVTNLSSINTSSSESYASLSQDGLTIYFSSGRSGRAGIYYATRELLTDDFGSPIHIPELDIGFGSFMPCISADGNALYFSSRASEGAEIDIYVSYIPEPASVLLLSLGAVMLRKRK